jgi:hypothetical protein
LEATYDTSTDTLSIIFNADARVVESDEDKPGVILDYNEQAELGLLGDYRCLQR